LAKDLKVLSRCGRVNLYAINIGEGIIIHCYCIYGATNGEKSDDAVAITNQCIEAIMQDVRCQVEVPFLIAGDVNATVARIPALQEAVDDGIITDVGAFASTLGGVDNAPTCQAHSLAEKTRRDYVFACSIAMKYINSFHVDWAGNFPVHAVIRISFNSKPQADHTDVVKLPSSLYRAFEDKCIDIYKEVNVLKAQVKAQKAQKASKTFVCDVNIKDEEAPMPDFPKKKATLAASISDVCDQLQQETDEQLSKQEEHDVACGLTNEQRSDELAELHKLMNKELDKDAGNWAKLLLDKDSSNYLIRFAQHIENAVVSYAGLTHSAAEKYRGRGKPNIKRAMVNINKPVIMHEGKTEYALSPFLSNLTTQVARLNSIRHCVAKNHSTSGDDNKARHTRNSIISKTRDAFLKEHKDGPGNDARDYLQGNSMMGYSTFTLDRHIKEFQANIDALRRAHFLSNRKKQKGRFQGRNMQKSVSKALKHNAPAPMTALKRVVDRGPGKGVGTLATSPSERDQVLHDAWDPITEGNIEDVDAAAARFMDSYQDFTVKLPEFKIGNLTMQSFKATCQSTKRSAAGLDGWASEDLSILSDQAYAIIVDLLNAIEHGIVEWPCELLETRAVFLSKDPNNTTNPLAYRGLKITSGIYRKWASNRLHDLDDWVAQWDHDALHVVGGKGAVNAWLRTSLRTELLQLEGLEVSGGSIDIFKCFDQLNRKLLLKLALRAGMPQRILNPYFAYIDNISVRFQVGETIGAPHKEKCSIPQGCPFSMMLVALVTRVWVNQMTHLNVEPRCLADDLMFTATGPLHRTWVVEAMHHSREFFHDLGARVATNKCFTFSTCKQTRQFFRDYTWKGQGFDIPCTSSFRDLGSHLNLTHAANGPTLTERMRRGVLALRRLRYLPITRKEKESIIRTHILPAALYGCEATYVCPTAFQNLRSAIIQTIGAHSARRNVDATFTFTGCNKDLDPWTYVLYNRVAGIRRILAKHPDCYKSVRLAIMHQNSRAQGSPHINGPAGLLVQQIQECNCTIDADLCIKQPNEPDIDAWNMPWQHLKKALYDLAARQRDQRFDSNRTFHGNVGEIDHTIVRSIVNRCGEKECRVYKYVATGSYWSEENKSSIDKSDGSCPHCGQTNIGSDHIHWRCHVINAHRKLRDLLSLLPDMIPDCVKVGIPPAMGIKFSQPFWGEALQPEGEPHAAHQILVGVPQGRARANCAAAENRIYQAVMDDIPNSSQLNARQAFALLRAADKKRTIQPLPYPCKVAAPEFINVFTDGSWQFPLEKYFSLGGAGVWWPNRKSTTLSTAEKDLALTAIEDQGIKLCAAIGGYTGSSTRTEIAAGIIAICCHGPAHIGSDSEVFVNGANEVIRMINEGTIHKKCWKIVSDGDLWEHFTNACIAKTTQAVRVTWVKGHATEEHIRIGVSTEQNRTGNDKADKLADLGVKMHGEETFDLARMFSKRHAEYTKFMQKVAQHIVEAHLIHKRLLEIKEAKEEQDRIARKREGVAYAPLHFPKLHQGQPLSFTYVITQFRAEYKAAPFAHLVQQFLVAQSYHAHDDGARGITWIELYTLYRIAGNKQPVPDAPANPATLAQNLAAFKRAVRTIVRWTSLDPRIKRMFEPDQCKQPQLKGLAIDGVYPAISCNLCISEHIQELLQYQLIKLTRRINLKSTKQFLQGEHTLPLRKIELKGAAIWDKNICKTAEPCNLHENAVPLQNGEGCGSERLYLPLNRIYCPSCGQGRWTKNTHIRRDNLGAPITCGGCKAKPRSLLWQCACDTPWATCDRHAILKAVETPKPKPKARAKAKGGSSSRPSIKRRIADADIGQLLEDDLRRVKVKTQGEFSPLDCEVMPQVKRRKLRPSLLPPGLRERFPDAIMSRELGSA
jgi:ribonuclease HI